MYLVQFDIDFSMNNDGDKTRYMKTLADAGIKPSVQRIEILDFVSRSMSHPTAEEIYAHLVNDNPALSRTTVFNNVRLLAEKGLVNDINIMADSTRYDSFERVPHAHFVCRRCRRIFDVPMDMASVATPAGFLCDNVNVYFKGVCPECRKSID